VTEDASPLQVWLGEDGWVDVPGVTNLVFEETEPDQLPPDLSLNGTYRALFEWQRPIDRALAILRPHLATEPLYQEQP
jgi:hypothetical protein